MKLTTNIPANPELYLMQDDGSLEKFSVGDKVTILMHNHNMRTGVISKIQSDYFCIRPVDRTSFQFDIESISLSTVRKIRRASIDDLSKSYFDEEEREFWMTHYVSRDGIVERTPADIAAMRRYLGEGGDVICYAETANIARQSLLAMWHQEAGVRRFLKRTVAFIRI